MSEEAFVFREICGCTVGVTCITDDLHYLQTVAAWQREQRKKPGLEIARLPIEQARTELSAAFRAMKVRGRWHWRAKNLTPKSCLALENVAPASEPQARRP